jgi:hypothetical protein
VVIPTNTNAQKYLIITNAKNVAKTFFLADIYAKNYVSSIATN